jgi:hypothetical protein
MRQLQIQKIEQKYKELCLQFNDFLFLSAEHDKCDFGLNGFEPLQEQRVAFTSGS